MKKVFEKNSAKKISGKNLRKKFLPALVALSWSGLRWVKVEREWNFLTRVDWSGLK